jgi:sodium/bile acid cotransporter 7
MHRILRAIDVYVLLMVLTVGVAVLMPASGRGAQVAGAAANAGIVFLFFLYGARLSPQAAISGITQWRLQGAVLLCTFALFPILGLAVKYLAAPSLPGPLITGILFLCLLPSTVQSSIAFTSIARGNIPAALCAASTSNVLGVFLSPVLAGWLLNTRGVAVSFGVFRDISLQLLLPFVVGQGLRPWIASWVQDRKRLLGFADRGSILLIIYVAFSKGVVDHVWGQVELADLARLVAALAGLLAVALITTAFIGRRLMRLTTEDEIVLQFCGSKKSLASGLPMATVLFSGPQLSLVVLPLMLFHQLQLMVCAVLAKRYAARPAD